MTDDHNFLETMKRENSGTNPFLRSLKESFENGNRPSLELLEYAFKIEDLRFLH